MNEVPFAPFRMDSAGLAEAPVVFPDTPVERARTAAASLRKAAALARALAVSGRPVDLSGLDGQVGRVCAGALDLSPEEGRALRPDLESLLAEIASLAAAMRLRSRSD